MKILPFVEPEDKTGVLHERLNWHQHHKNTGFSLKIFASCFLCSLCKTGLKGFMSIT